MTNFYHIETNYGINEMELSEMGVLKHHIKAGVLLEKKHIFVIKFSIHIKNGFKDKIHTEIPVFLN